MVNNKKNVIGEVNVEVKAGLSVDDKTARICMDLLSIYFKQEPGVEGVILIFEDSGFGNVGVRPLTSKEAVSRAWEASITHVVKED